MSVVTKAVGDAEFQRRFRARQAVNAAKLDRRVTTRETPVQSAPRKRRSFGQTPRVSRFDPSAVRAPKPANIGISKTATDIFTTITITGIIGALVFKADMVAGVLKYFTTLFHDVAHLAD